MHVEFFFYSVIFENGSEGISLERRGGTGYSKLWTPTATLIDKMEKFPFL